MKWEYFVVLGAMVFFPLVLSRERNLSIWKRSTALLKSILVASIPFWIWDVLVTERGHWSFNPNYVVGISLLGLPIEEWLFFIVIAFVSIFTWESIRHLTRKKG